jgi:hypothetical protein
MEYPTIEIEGEEYPFVLGRGALNAYALKHGHMDVKTKEIDKVLMDMTLADQLELNYLCFKVACGAKDIEFPYSLDEFHDVVQENPHLLDEIDNISEAQQPAGNPMEAVGSQ